MPGVVVNDLADAMLAAIDGEPAFGAAPFEGESMTDYRRRLKRAEVAAMWGYIETNARVTVNPIVTVTSVSAVTPGVGVSGPGTGTSTDAAGTIT